MRRIEGAVFRITCKPHHISFPPDLRTISACCRQRFADLFERLLPIYGQQKLDPLKIEYQLNPKSRPEIELILERLCRARLLRLLLDLVTAGADS